MVDGIKRSIIKSIPIVTFDSVDTQITLTSLFVTDRNIYEHLGLVLLRLDFKASDIICFSNYNREKNTFDCIVNDKEVCTIGFEKIDQNKEFMKIIMNKGNIQLEYDCIPADRTELGFKIIQSKYIVKLLDERKFIRYLSSDFAKFGLCSDDYLFELEFVRPNDFQLPIFDSNGRYSKYKLEHEEEIFRFLGTLKFPVSIIDVYEQFLKMGIVHIDRYQKVSFKLYRKENDSYKLNDIIELSDGEIAEIKTTYEMDNSSIYIEGSGNYLYKISRDATVPVDFEMSYMNGSISCNLFCDSEYDLENYMNKNVKSDIYVATEEIEKVRKRMRTLTPKKIK